MKKKGLKTMAVSAVAGCLLLSYSVSTFASTGSGYESYKKAIEATMLTKNATVSTQFEVKDNGTSIFSGDSTQKIDQENQSSKTSITVDGTSKTYENSVDKGNVVSVADGKYYTNKRDEKVGKGQREKLSPSSNTVKLAEMVTDTLVGDVKNQFVQDGQTISVKLEGAQIPELARLALSAAAENSNRMDHNKDNGKQGYNGSMKSVMDKLPTLSNIDIKSIAMTATVGGDTLKDNEYTITLTGQDTNGNSHELTVELNATIANVGSTKIDAIDTTGKEVTTLDRANQHRN